MIFVREDIPSKLLQKHVMPVDVEALFVELNLGKCKLSLFGTYHRSSQEDQYCYKNLSKALDTYCQYDKIFLSVDFSSEDSEVCLD